MPGSDPHLIVTKNDIHAPVDAVLHAPVRPDGMCDALCIRSKTADVVTALQAGLVAHSPLGLQHHESAQSWPAFWLWQALELVENMAATNLQPAMVLLDMLEVRMGYPGRIAVQKSGSEVRERSGQLRLVSLDGKQIVRPAIENGLCNVRLGTHGIDRHGAALKRQCGQQLRNGGLLVGLLGGRPLPEIQP